MPHISVKSENDELIVELQGGQLVQWNHNGVGVFYQGSSIRRSGIPILFPFANPLIDNIFNISGKEIGQHGFGRDSLWRILNQTDSSITLSLSSQDITPEMQIAYPFDFEANILLEVLDDTMKYTLSVTNNNKVDLPIAPGLHPYLPIKHEKKSELIISGINNTIDWESESNGYFNDYNRKIELSFPDGQIIEITEVDTNHFENIVLWSQTPTNEDSDFICVEPFTKKTNAINENPILVKPYETWSSTILFKIKK